MLESASLASQVQRNLLQRNLQVQRNLQMVSGAGLAARVPAFSGLQQVMESASLADRGQSKDYKLLSGLVTSSSAVSALQQALESAGLAARGQMRNYQLLSGVGARSSAVSELQRTLESVSLVARGQIKNYQLLSGVGASSSVLSGFQQALQSAARGQTRDYQLLWDVGLAAKSFKSVESSRMLANLHVAASFEAARVDRLPEQQVDPIVEPQSVGWLSKLLNDEASFRAIVPYLATSSVGCILAGLQLVALVDPAVKAALEVLSYNTTIAGLLVTLVMFMDSRRP